MKSYKELEIWKRSMLVVTEVYRITKDFPRDEVFGLTSQIRRASVSIPSNIAEGWARKTGKSFIQFLNISRGSLAELETLLIISSSLNYIKEEEFKILTNELEQISKMLFSFIQKLNIQTADVA